MARQRLRLNVTVHLTNSGRQVDYDGWVTAVDIGKDGALRLFDGWKQRAYHPSGEWTGYTVEKAAKSAVLGVVTPRSAES